MCAAWRVSCSDHSQWNRKTGMPHLSLATGSISQYAALIRDHFAAAAEVHERAVVAANVFLELLPVAAAREPLESCSGRQARHTAAAAKLDVIPARESQFGCCSLYSHHGVYMWQAAGAVLVVRRQILQQRHLSMDVGADRIHEIFANLAARVRESIGERRRLRVEQNAGRLARARRQHDDTRGGMSVSPCLLIDEIDAVGSPCLIQCDLVAPWRPSGYRACHWLTQAADAP